VEALHAAFGVDEAAGGLGERRDGQQHVGVRHHGILERVSATTIPAFQRGPGRGSVRRIQHRLGVQQQQRLHRLGQHLARVQPALGRLAPTSCAPTVLAASVR
jgi:hypothetical protein